MKATTTDIHESLKTLGVPTTATCEANGVNPLAYLTDVLGRIAPTRNPASTNSCRTCGGRRTSQSRRCPLPDFSPRPLGVGAYVVGRTVTPAPIARPALTCIPTS